MSSAVFFDQNCCNLAVLYLQPDKLSRA